MKYVMGIIMLFSVSAQALNVDLKCGGTDKSGNSNLQVEQINQGGAFGAQSVLEVKFKNRKGRGTTYFGDQEFDVTQLRYHKVILGDNGKEKARIVINDEGRADVTLQDAISGQYLVLRKVVPCSSY